MIASFNQSIRCRSIRILLGHRVADALTLDIHLTQPALLVTVIAGQVPATICPAMETLRNFASHPIGTGPYAVIRQQHQSTENSQAFDDFFGYRALID
ncbi:hypothetical protein ACNKHV_00380 [Shigella flexneri]